MPSDRRQQTVALKEAPAPSEENGKVDEVVEELPVLSSPDSELSARNDILRLLRRFHLGGPDEATDSVLETVGDDVLPALLAPFRDASRIRYGFPLFLYPSGEGEGDELALPLSDFLRDRVAEFAPGEDQSRILKDNLARIERFVRGALEGSSRPTEAAELLELAAKALPDELKLDGDNRTNLEADLEKLLTALPPGGRLLAYGNHATIHLFLQGVRHRLILRRRAFTYDVEQLAKKVRDLLRVEESKSAEARAPEAVGSAMGEAASRYINPVALAETTMGSPSGSEPMPAERRKRVEAALAALEAFVEERSRPLTVIVHNGTLDPSWLADESDCELQEAVDPCLLASSVFDRKVAEYAEVFRAVRVAELELAQNYDPNLHNPWFANFSWEAFSRQELLLLPVVVAVETADRIAGTGMSSFSRLLRSGRPIQILAEVQPSGSPGTEAGEDPLSSYRLELGYVGISHRHAIIAQTSLARPNHLLEGFLQALDGTRPSLHLLSTGAFDGNGPQRLSAWLQAGAALESRAHPFFRYNPEVSHAWTECMDFSENPAPEVDWPHYPISYRDGGPEGEHESVEEAAFSFADFALLDPKLRQHYRLVPQGFERDELIPIDTYLELESAEAFKQLPFIWVVDGKSSLRRVVLSREIVLSCIDHLGYWRTLQALAGTRNEHAEVAARKAREKAQEEAAAERESLETAHGEEVARVREETAGEVMQRLAEVLMGLDLTQAPQAAVPAPPPPVEVSTEAPEAEPGVEEAPAEAEAEEEEVSFDAPWIDTVLCTSCNDCMKVNPLVFVYNENKQALIGDPKAGTFEQLVIAAEKCPARCIHPGKPLNPDEPNLDELIERAKPFNQ
jgi:ferredoxin